MSYTMPSGREISDQLAREAFQTLSDAQIKDLRRFGEERSVKQGDSLSCCGDYVDTFQVVLEGEVCVFEPYDSDGHYDIVGVSGIVGDLGQLTGQKAILSCEAQKDGRVLEISRERLMEAIATIPTIADSIITSFRARRDLLMQTSNGLMVIVGKDKSSEVQKFASLLIALVSPTAASR